MPMARVPQLATATLPNSVQYIPVKGITNLDEATCRLMIMIELVLVPPMLMIFSCNDTEVSKVGERFGLPTRPSGHWPMWLRPRLSPADCASCTRRCPSAPPAHRALWTAGCWTLRESPPPCQTLQHGFRTCQAEARAPRTPSKTGIVSGNADGVPYEFIEACGADGDKHPASHSRLQRLEERCEGLLVSLFGDHSLSVGSCMLSADRPRTGERAFEVPIIIRQRKLLYS